MTWLLGKPPRSVVEFKFVRIEYLNIETSKHDVIIMSETLRLCVVRAGQGAPHDPDVMETEPFPAAFQQVVHRILPCGFEPCRPPAPADDHAQRFIPWLGVERDQREGK